MLKLAYDVQSLVRKPSMTSCAVNLYAYKQTADKFHISRQHDIFYKHPSVGLCMRSQPRLRRQIRTKRSFRISPDPETSTPQNPFSCNNSDGDALFRELVDRVEIGEYVPRGVDEEERHEEIEEAFLAIGNVGEVGSDEHDGGVGEMWEEGYAALHRGRGGMIGSGFCDGEKVSDVEVGVR